VLPPGWFPDYSTIARFCNERGAFDLALQAALAGIARNPREPLLHLRLAQTYDGRGEPERAIATCDAALALDPSADTRAQLLAARALALESAGRIDEALASARSGIDASPESLEPHRAYGSILAHGGALLAAWPELAFYFLEERAWFRRRFGVAEWNGEELGERRLAIVHGQGAGDFLQMARYLPRLRARAAELIVEVPPALAPLIGRCDGVTFVAKDTFVRGPGDAFGRAMVLPQILAETGDVPSPAYLRAPEDRLERWRARLGRRRARLRVGLVWAGNPYHSHDHFRSLPLATFAPLAAVDDVEWIALQVGPRSFEAPPPGFALAVLRDEIRDFADTAAIVASCDLVIAVDTAVAHLAGAIGAEVWVLLSTRPEWRWPLAGEQSPWYASMRLVHCDARGWPATIERVAEALRERVAAR
jgi:tetratricopeptide (TPR) repeat protein